MGCGFCCCPPNIWFWRPCSLEVTPGTSGQLEGIVSKRLGSFDRSGRSPDWLKFKNPDAPAVKREAEKDWGR